MTTGDGSGEARRDHESGREFLIPHLGLRRRLRGNGRSGDYLLQFRLPEDLQQGTGDGPVIRIDNSEAEVERLSTLESEAHQRGDPQWGDKSEDDRRAVSHALAQVLARDDEGGVHSRSAVPVRWRKTASRSGSTTSTLFTAMPARSAASRTAGRMRRPSSATSCTA